MTDRKPVRRYRDALAAQAGACNPHALARALVSALDECRAEDMDTPRTCADAGVRLIAHQLAFLLKVRELDTGVTEYHDATVICEARQ